MDLLVVRVHDINGNADDAELRGFLIYELVWMTGLSQKSA